MKLTKPQMAVLTFLFKRRNPARFTVIMEGTATPEARRARRTDLLSRTIRSLTPDFIETADATANDPVYELTHRGREVVENVVAHQSDTE